MNLSESPFRFADVPKPDDPDESEEAERTTQGREAVAQAGQPTEELPF
jgi:hypothetical protein